MKKQRNSNKKRWIILGVVLILVISYLALVVTYYIKTNRQNHDALSSKAFEYCTFSNLQFENNDPIQASIDKISSGELPSLFASAKLGLKQREILSRITFWTNFKGLKDKYYALNATINFNQEQCDNTASLLAGIKAYGSQDYELSRNLTYYVAEKYKDSDMFDGEYFSARLYQASSTFRNDKNPQSVRDGSEIYNQVLQKRYSHIFAENYMFGYNMYAEDLIKISDYKGALTQIDSGISVSKEIMRLNDEPFKSQLAQLYYARGYANAQLGNKQQAINDLNESIKNYDLKQSRDLLESL
jgi:hypothetical protein